MASYHRNRVRSLGRFQDDLCFFCEQPLVYLDPTKKYAPHTGANHGLVASVDHYLSRAVGGGGQRENIVIAHRDCNSHKGHAQTPEFDEKMRQLNIRRGFGDENGDVHPDRIMRRLRPEEFGPADCEPLIFLCELANQYEGDAGKRIRDTITKRIQDHYELIKAFTPVESIDLRRQAISAIRAIRAQNETRKLPAPLGGLLSTFQKAMTDRACSKEPSKKQIRRERRRERLMRELSPHDVGVQENPSTT